MEIRTTTTRALMGLLAAALLPVGVLGHASPASAADIMTWVIDADRLTITEAQEDCFLCSGGDEPYIAVVQYRSTFGVPGSTSAEYRAGLRELASNAGDRKVLTIPDSMGRATFPSVSRVSATQIAAGFAPEVIGTITVAMESDHSPDSDMRDIFRKLARVAKQEIASAVETTTTSDFIGATMDPAKKQRLADRIEAAVKRIESRTQLSFWDKAELWAVSVADPDDKIAFKISAFVAVDHTLASFVDPEVAKVLPSGKGIGGALLPRSTSVRYNGDDADYTVDSLIGVPL